MASGGGGWSTQKRSTFADRWDKSTSKAILQGILDAVTLPGDVYRGEVDPRSDEAIGRAFDLAGTLTLGAGAIPRRGLELRSGMSRKGHDTPTALYEPDMLEAYDVGKKIAAVQEKEGLRGRAFYEDWAYQGIKGLPDFDATLRLERDPTLKAFMEMGRKGHSLPVPATGWRYGTVPPGGVSRNYREDLDELGVSMAGVDDIPEWSGYEWFDAPRNKHRPKTKYRGYLLPEKGGDDEPLFVGLRPFAGTNSAAAGVGPAGQPAPRGIRAYHGSPHSFDKFSSERIGTGEGAQAYGHGLYFAENEGVARNYKDAGPASRALYDEVNERMSELARIMGSDAIPGRGREFRSDVGRKAAEEYDALMKKRENLGNTYEVDIAANPEDFLDWDKPLSEQSAQVQSAFKAMGNRAGDFHPADAIGRASRNELFAGDMIGKDRATHQEVTDAMRQAGIPGIRYLDQGSRAPQINVQELERKVAQMESDRINFPTDASSDADIQKQIGLMRSRIQEEKARQSSNYVVFDDSLISILKKYGVVGPVLAALGLSQALPDRAEASEQQGGGW